MGVKDVDCFWREYVWLPGQATLTCLYVYMCVYLHVKICVYLSIYTIILAADFILELYVYHMQIKLNVKLWGTIMKRTIICAICHADTVKEIFKRRLIWMEASGMTWSWHSGAWRLMGRWEEQDNQSNMTKSLSQSRG